MDVAIVVPVLNEEQVIATTLAHLRALQPAPEILVVDGGSSDRTWDLLQRDLPRGCVRAPRGRGMQLNAGARRATAQLLVFLHADTHLPQESYAACRTAAERGAMWGWFDVALDDTRLAYRVHARIISQRAAVFQSPTGDQGLFVRRTLFESVGGYPELALMEDVALAKALRARTRGVRIRQRVITSARRWRELGLSRTILRMWSLKLQYLAGRDPEALARLYPHVR